MTKSDPTFTIGIEEEYLLVDKTSRDLVHDAPQGLMDECEAELKSQVSPEFLQCQIEVGTRVCKSVADARDDLGRLRQTISNYAAKHNLAPIAASTHPFASWQDQHFTDKERSRDPRQGSPACGPAHADLRHACSRVHRG